ncbi:APC family permease [Pseudonocardia sp. MH-G8]|uniref:APC family permease n=1 Tax=Pseudonocardia sp. MH-G8 TaxID=1854588 RepID=UPI001E62AD8C|nr:APC family permease [Pseudonocardia sp. MH-G8]
MSSSVQRRLGTADATVLGLAAMLGTGVFAVWAPAAAAAGPWLLLAVVLAGVVAACNAASTADLAVAHPESGGGYVYGRARLSPGAGRLAGVAFLVGKTASAAAAAGVFGSYVLPSAPLPAAAMVIVAATVLNSTGVRWTSRGAYALVGGTLAVLLVVVAIGLLGPEQAAVATAATPDVEPVPTRGGVFGVLTAAGLVFFAFAGYARIATLGEEVRDPHRTLRRAIALALGIAMLTYLLVAAALLAGLGADRLATEAAPLVAVVDGGEASALGVLVRAGAAVAAGSALLSVLVGVSRTALAMARRGELPTGLAAISSRGTPRRADIVGGLVAIGIAAFAGPVAAIALSACSVLVYYAVINLSALRLPAAQRSWPHWTSCLGLLLCLGLAALLPTHQVVTTAVALAVGWVLCTVLGRSGAAG